MENEIIARIEYIPEFRDYIPTSRICGCKIVDKLFSVFFLGYGTYYLLVYQAINWATGILWIFAVVSWFDWLGILIQWIGMKIDPKYKEKYQLSFSDSGIGYQTSKLESHIEWEFYGEYVDLDHAFVLLYGKCGCTVIPKRAFSSKEEIKNVSKLLKENLKHKRKH